MRKKFDKDLLDNLLEATIVGSFSKIGFEVRSRLYDYRREYNLDSFSGHKNGSDSHLQEKNSENRNNRDNETVKTPVAVITGFSSGIGLATALSLAKAGWQIIGIAHNKERCEAALARILAANKTSQHITDPHEIRSLIYNGKTGDHLKRTDKLSYGVMADLSNLSEVKNLASMVRANHTNISLIIHCAGKIYPELTLTPDGFESTFALHVLGPQLLTDLLYDLLEIDPDLFDMTDNTSLYLPRVVWVSSGGMYAVGLETKRLLNPDSSSYKAIQTYAYAKRMQVELAEIWAVNLAGKNCLAFSMHPGFVNTRVLEEGIPLFTKIMRPLLRTPEQGADTLVYLSTLTSSHELAKLNGSFFLDRKPRKTNILKKTVSLVSEKIDAFSVVENLLAPFKNL